MNRKKNIYIESKKGKLVALLITCFVLMLSVGYTALNENLTISGEAAFRVEEDIRVTKINILETNSLTTVNYMFNSCNKLNYLDIRNMDFENKTITTSNIFDNVSSGVNIYVKNAYIQTYIQGLKSDANVIIYVPSQPEPE